MLVKSKWWLKRGIMEKCEDQKTPKYLCLKCNRLVVNLKFITYVFYIDKGMA